MKRFAAIALLNLLGAALMASFLHPQGHALWRQLDGAVFFFFNRQLTPGSFFLYLTAVTNVRAFDLVSVLCMGTLYWRYFRLEDDAGKRRIIATGLVMVAVAVTLKQLCDSFPFNHPSPTRLDWPFEVNRVSRLTSIGAKDADINSFPGDHGMMLMIFAAFMARNHGRKAFFAAALIVAVFSMPRIMSGAHWFSDVYMGSLSIVCLSCPWLLLTPVAERLAALFERLLPRFVYGTPPSEK